MVDEYGVCATFCLGAFTGVVDEEGVDQRQVGYRLVRVALARQAHCLTGKPFHVAVLTHVDDRVCPKNFTQPEVGSQVVVVGGKIRVVIDAHWVITETTWRLHHDHDVAEHQAGDVDLLGLGIDVVRAGGRTPVLRHFFLHDCRESVKESLVILGADLQGVGSQYLLGQPVRVVAACVDDGVHKGVAIHERRVIVITRNRGGVAQVVSGVIQRFEHAQRRCRGIQAHSVADAGVLGGVCRQHDDDLLVFIAQVPQAGVPVRDRR